MCNVDAQDLLVETRPPASSPDPQEWLPDFDAQPEKEESND